MKPSLIFLLIVSSVYGCRRCNIFCSKGQYCHGSECLPCKNGSYQDSAWHQNGDCIPWTTKPKDSHWVIMTHGNSTSDNVWDCEAGYRINEYAVSEFDCPPVETTASERTTSTPKPLDSAQTTSSSGKTTKKDGRAFANQKNRDVYLIITCLIISAFI